MKNGAHKPALSAPERYFTPPRQVIFALLVLLGLLLRWIGLDSRPIHHDEAIHALYGKYFFDSPETRFYKYDPMTHGPMVYNALRLSYTLFGVSDWSARAPAAVLGSLLLFAPLLFRRFLKPGTVLASTAALALSPSLIYWSRFLREDIWVLCGLALMLWGFAAAPERWRSFWVVVSFTLQWCTKINAAVHLAVFLGFLVFEFGFNSLILRHRSFLAGRMLAHIKRYPREFLIGILTSILIYSWFFSSGFRYPEGIFDGLARGIAYWAGQHSTERIAGPFLSHLYLLAWYELPWIIALLLQTVLFYSRAGKEFRIAGGLTLLLAASACLFLPGEYGALAAYPLFNALHLKSRLDLIGCAVLFFSSFAVTIHHLRREETTLALAGYLFFATLFVYSYLGEKTPWLSLYPFAAGLSYFALYFQDYALNSFAAPSASTARAFFSPGALLVVLGALFNTRAALQTNFIHAGAPSEFIGDVHTTGPLDQAARQIASVVRSAPANARPTIIVNGASFIWPLGWYFRDIEAVYSATPGPPDQTYTYRFESFHEASHPCGPTDQVQKVPFRGWWLPDYDRMTFRGFLNYALNHIPWNDPGFKFIWLCENQSWESAVN